MTTAIDRMSIASVLFTILFSSAICQSKFARPKLLTLFIVPVSYTDHGRRVEMQYLQCDPKFKPSTAPFLKSITFISKVKA